MDRPKWLDELDARHRALAWKLLKRRMRILSRQASGRISRKAASWLIAGLNQRIEGIWLEAKK